MVNKWKKKHHPKESVRFLVTIVFCYQNCAELLWEKKKCSSDWEKLLKSKAEGWEFAKILRSLE